MPHPSCRKWQIRMEVRADTQLFEKDLSITVSACSVTQSCLTLWAQQALLSMGFSRQESWVRWHALLQGSFPTQGSDQHHFCLQRCQAGSLPSAPPGKPQTVNTSTLLASGDHPLGSAHRGISAFVQMVSQEPSVREQLLKLEARQHGDLLSPPVTALKGKGRCCVCVALIRLAVPLKLTQPCQSMRLQ